MIVVEIYFLYREIWIFDNLVSCGENFGGRSDNNIEDLLYGIYDFNIIMGKGRW